MNKGIKTLLIILVLLLLAVMVSCGAHRIYEKNQAAAEEQTALEAEAMAEAEEAEEEINIPGDRLVELLNESSALWEFAQRLSDEIILYKNELGRYDYVPVNKDLRLSDYNWDCLEQLLKSHKEMEYRVDGQAVSIKGIDVSTYQGDIDWEQVAGDGVKFAIIRVGYRGYSSGELTLDDRFEQNIVGALQNGIDVGVYFVTQAISVEEAKEEAEFVLEQIAPYKVTWPVVLDIEASSGSNPRTEDLEASQRTNYAKAFCGQIEQSGYTPMIYSNIGWFINKLELERLDGYDKWFAQYFNRPFFPYEFQIWQYTSSGAVAGIKGNVDLNISMYDYGAGEYVPYKGSQE